MGFLSLLDSGDTSAPNQCGLVSNDKISPLRLCELIGNILQLICIDSAVLVIMYLLMSFTNASHDRHTIFNGYLRLHSDILVKCSIEISSFGVADECPVNTDVFEHASSNIPSVSYTRML